MSKILRLLFTAVMFIAISLPVASYAAEPVMLESTSTVVEETTEAFDALEATSLVPITGDYVEGEAIVILENDELAPLFGTSAAEEFSLEPLMTVESNARTDILAEDDIMPLFGADPETQTISLARSETLDTESLIEALENRPGVIAAEPNYLYHLESADPDLTSSQYMASADAGINVPSWNQPGTSNTSDDLVVAVVDSGVDYGHDDLKNVMWGDGFKYAALIGLGGGQYGFNAAAKVGFEDTFGIDNPMDNNSHGTHCAGIIAGEWNGYGISGIANGAKIMSVKITNAAGQVSSAATIAGYEYIAAAIDAGVNVRVVSNSWGGPFSSRAVSMAVKAVTDRGALATFAAGNETADVDASPMTYYAMRSNPRVVVVNAVDDQGNYASFSNYGANNTDVAAPGVDIMSSIMRTKAVPFDGVSRLLSGNDFDTPSDLFAHWEDGDGTSSAVTSAAGKTGNGLALTASAQNNASVSFQAMDVLGFRPRYLSFDFKVDSNESRGAAVRLFIPRINGGTASVGAVDEIDGCETWKRYSAELPEDTDYRHFAPSMMAICVKQKSADGKPDVVFGETMCFDNFAFTNDVYAYENKSGTSMATPVVSGEAAVLMTAFPDDSVDQIAARIVGSVKRKDSHADKCISGGIVNLGYALEGRTAPVLFSTSRANNGIAINGYFFGSEKGTVTIDGTPAEVESWNDTSIVIAEPENLTAGSHLFEVTRPGGDETLRSGHRRLTASVTGALSRIAIGNQFGSRCIGDMATLHGKIYFSSDSENDDFMLHEYDPVTESFTELYHDKNRIAATTLATYNGKLVVVVRNNRYKDTVYEAFTYEPYSGAHEFHELTATPKFMPASTLVVWNDTLLTIGGVDLVAGDADNSICKLSLDDYTLVKAGNLTEARFQFGTFVQTGDQDAGLYVCFGARSTGHVTSVERVDLVDGEYIGTIIADYAENQKFSKVDAITCSLTTGASSGFVYGLRQTDSDNNVVSDACTVRIVDGQPVFTDYGQLLYGSELVNPVGVMCDGYYYLTGISQENNGEIVFGRLGGFEEVHHAGDVMPRTSVTVGGLTLSYQSHIEYLGTAIKAPDLGVTVTDSTGRCFELGTVSYKANKNAGTATFTVKTLKVTKADKALQKVFAKTPLSFTILKRTLTSDNTEVKLTKKGAVSSVKFYWTYANAKGKILTKRFTVPKKEYTLSSDGYITIKDTSKNYTGRFKCN